MDDQHATFKDIQPQRIEITTFAGVVGPAADEQLAAAMNDGWEVLDISATSVVLMGEVVHHEVVKLMRLVDEDDDAAAPATEAAAAPTPATEDASPPTSEDASPPTPLPEAGEGSDGRPPIPPPGSKQVVTGMVVGMDASRTPLEDVSFAEALASGWYSGAELIEIGNREIQVAGRNLLWQRQQNRAGQVWTGLVMRLPDAVPAG